MAVTPRRTFKADWLRVSKVLATFVLCLPFLLLSSAGVYAGAVSAATAFFDVKQYGMGFYYLLLLFIGALGVAACVSLLITTGKGGQIRHRGYHMAVLALGMIMGVISLISLLILLNDSGNKNLLVYIILTLCICVLGFRQFRQLNSESRDASARYSQEES